MSAIGQIEYIPSTVLQIITLFVEWGKRFSQDFVKVGPYTDFHKILMF